MPLKGTAGVIVVAVKRIAIAVGLTISITIAVLGIATTVVVYSSGDDNFQYVLPKTTINDITQLNPTRVARVIEPRSVEEVSAALRDTMGPVSIGGGRFSQGGQISYPDSLHLDMRNFNRVLNLDAERKLITVESGITWRQLQEYIDPYNLSVKIMQTYSNFTIGGSLSVNVHGRYIGEGPLVRSVQSIKLVLADGSVVDASPSSNTELFYGAIGGYGGLGVIVEATLALADNVMIERRDTVLPVTKYRAHFMKEIRDDPDVVFHNADLYPPDFAVARDVSWYRSDKPVTIEDRLVPTDDEYVWQPRFANVIAGSDAGKWFRQHVLDPVYYAHERVAWRNWEASYDVAELEPVSRTKTTYGLREYFVPVAQFDAFVPRMRDIFSAHDANILNVSVRHALPDPGTLLAWADEEVFAFVVYFRQDTSAAEIAKVKAWTLEMNDAAVELGGAYYLPYQVFETPEQFHRAYPRYREYFDLKACIDPNNRFRNRLWQRHYPPNRDALQATRDATKNYYRGEEQTFLTIPEWYLVFNPVEYAEFLANGNNPSDFPFFTSIDEFWTLYDRVRNITAVSRYPDNSEYLTMLRVIGVSTTLEYLIKGAYETTIGRFSRWTAGGEDTAEDRVIQRAHQAYGEFIFGEPWYEFDFGSWLGTFWTEADFFGENFIRKLERRVFFTLEYGGKAGYAKLIKFAAKATYGEKDDHVYLTVVVPDGAAEIPGVEAIQTDGHSRLVSILRWGPFTEAAVKLAAAGFDFVDVSGNRQIAVSLVGKAGEAPPAVGAAELFESRVLSSEELQRHVLLVEVRRLGEFLRELTASNMRLEHIYDY